MDLPEGTSVTYIPTVSFQEVEYEYIRKAVVYHDGNLTKAAKALGISRATMYRKIERARRVKSSGDVVNETRS